MSDLRDKVAGGHIMSLKERADRKSRNERRRAKKLGELKAAGHVEARGARLADLPVTSPSDDGARVLHGGYLAPALELNSLRPAQIGLIDDTSGDWFMRAHPVIVFRPEDLGLFTQPETGITRARAVAVISYPYENEYFISNLDQVFTRAFNSINPRDSASPACLCFYGDTDLGPENPDDDEEIELPDDPPQLGDGIVTAPGIYDPEKEDELLLQCSNPKTIPMDAFTARGRIIIYPHPDADYTDFLVYVRDAEGRLIDMFTRFVASRNIFGPASPVYGSTELGLDDHVVDGAAYGHAIGGGLSGSGTASGGDGISSGSQRKIRREVTLIGTGAGPAIVDVTVRYPLVVTQSGFRFTTLSAWATRLR